MSLIGITNVESRKRRTPFIEQLNKLLLVKQFGDRVLDDETDTDAVQNRAERGFPAVYDKRAIDNDVEPCAVFEELPGIGC
ncbi:hypothetical protein D3C87_1779910 [compost metagenome]